MRPWKYFPNNEVLEKSEKAANNSIVGAVH